MMVQTSPGWAGTAHLFYSLPTSANEKIVGREIMQIPYRLFEIF